MKPNTQSDWVKRSLHSVWHPCTQMQHHETVPLIPVSHGRGAWLYDADGFNTALEHELLLRPIGRTVYLMPPYVLDDAECDTLAARTAAVFESVIADE